MSNPQLCAPTPSEVASTVLPYAFDISYAEHLNKGEVIEASNELGLRALATAGLDAKEMVMAPIVFRPLGHAEDTSGRISFEHPENNHGPIIQLFASDKEHNASASTLAHEGKHLYDWLHHGESSFTSSQQRRNRKIAASVLGAFVGGTDAVLVGVFVIKNPYVAAATAPVITSMTLTHALRTEYRSRKEEKRARDTEASVSHRSITRVIRPSEYEPATDVTNNVGIPQRHQSRHEQIAKKLRHIFVPNYAR